jgi:hypothetical protein
MSEQQTVTITKKQQLDTAGQAWVDYHMNHLRKHMAALGMIQPQEDIAPIIEANHLEEDPVYSPRIDDVDHDAGGEMIDDDPVPVKKGKKKPSAQHEANRGRVRRFIMEKARKTQRL